MENGAVRSYVARHASEILEQLELVLNTVSMEEAVEQAEREEGPSGTASAAQTNQSKMTVKQRRTRELTDTSGDGLGSE